jgi:histidinol-phosphate aminotransferase
MPVDFQKLPHAGVRSLIPYKPGKSIEELKHEKGLTDIIKMASNENPLGCSPLALEALRQIASTTLATYPSALNHPLMPKLAQKMNLTPEQLLLSNGSDYIFGLLIQCFALHSNKHVLTHDYAFSTYAIQAQGLQVPVVSVAVNEDRQINVDALIEHCTEETALIFIANPNNPTGLLLKPEQIKRILEKIPKDTLFVLDEAYHEFACKEFGYNSIEWLNIYPNLVITRTFSKIYGMAGLRLGYAMAHPDIINILQRVQLPFVVNQAALNAAYAALDDEDFISRSLAVNHAGMKQLKEGFDTLNIYYYPSACNFLTIHCKEDGIPLYNYLLDQGIIIRPLHPYAMADYVRVSVGTQEQNARFLYELERFLRQQH